MKRKKILFYIDSPWPTDEQRAEAEKHGAAFRNVRYFDKPEQCDGVMGLVPDGYSADLVIEKPKRGRPKKSDD